MEYCIHISECLTLETILTMCSLHSIAFQSKCSTELVYRQQANETCNKCSSQTKTLHHHQMKYVEYSQGKQT